MTSATVQRAVIKTTHATLGVVVSPHMFRTSAATSAAMHAGGTPHLASALLNHRDVRVTEKHYNRASVLSAGKTYSEVIETYTYPPVESGRH
jgi:integrase